MAYSIDEVFDQASNDDYAVSMTGYSFESHMVYGIKIIKDTSNKEIKLFDTMKRGDYFVPLTKREVEIFLENGWRYGVYVLSLDNYRTKLDKIEQRIQKCIAEKKSSKQISIQKSSRERILKKYSEINLKLNQLNYGNSKEKADNI